MRRIVVQKKMFDFQQNPILRSFVFLVWAITLTTCTRNLPQAISQPISTPVEAVNEAATPVESEALTPTVALVMETATPERAFENDRPLAARVNDEPIFLETYQKQVAQFEQTLVSQGIDLSSENGQTALIQIQRQVLDALIDQAIIEQEAQKLSISVSNEVVEAKAQESIVQGQNQEQFESWLQANDLTYEEFQDTLRFQLVANQMFEQITGSLPETADQIQLRQILVSEETTAREIIAQLKVGTNFAALAQTYSIDESNRANGGSLGWFPRQAGLIPATVEEIAFTLQPNEVSGPIQTSLGFHIIQLEAKEAERPLKIEMLQALKEQLFSKWLAEQRAASTIEKFVAL